MVGGLRPSALSTLASLAMTPVFSGKMVIACLLCVPVFHVFIFFPFVGVRLRSPQPMRAQFPFKSTHSPKTTVKKVRTYKHTQILAKTLTLSENLFLSSLGTQK
jgi:hypothetical protein